jgi:putative ABC transport system permease protein
MKIRSAGVSGSAGGAASTVGVVADVMYEPLDRRPNRSSFYTPFTQFSYGFRTYFVRTAGEPTQYISALRKAVSAVDPETPMLDVRPLSELMGESWARHRFDAMLFAGFGIAALVLAATGIFAVVAYAVGERTREMGIRIALGAPAKSVMRLIVGEGMVFPLVGLLLGVVAALGATRLLRASLYEVTPTEPGVFALTVLLLVAIAVAACLVPARRATRVSPMEAMKV